MIRHLHPTDSPGLLQFSQSSGQGEVCSLVGALRGGPGGFPTVKYAGIALSPRAWQSCWVEAHRGRIDGVLRAAPRSGPQAWEVGEFYLRKGKSELATELLEQIAVPAGGAGAHRIFVRVPANSALSDEAVKAGYSILYRESVFVAENGSKAANNLGVPDRPTLLRRRQPSDDHGLFRMYSANTPAEIRMKTGQTTDDWNAGRERLGRKVSEWIYELEDGSVGALLQQNSTRWGRMFKLEWSSESGSQLESFVGAALADTSGGRVATAVPEFNPALSHLLVTLGLEEQAQYEVMVKQLAQTVTEASRAFAAIG